MNDIKLREVKIIIFSLKNKLVETETFSIQKRNKAEIKKLEEENALFLLLLKHCIDFFFY